MKLCQPITRRQAIKAVTLIGGALCASDLCALAFGAETPFPGARFLVEGKGTSPGYTIPALVRTVFQAAGGMEKFVSRGDVVAIKPNISWARSPELGANTHPEVLRSVVELCFDAGARKVRIVDHPVHEPRRCFAITGAFQIAKETGAELVFPRSTLMRKMKIRGARVETWPVLSPVVEADKLINIPVAKHHSLSGLTLGMKNWIGAVGGARWRLHQDINQSIVDLARFFNPTLTLIDAIRIMTKNGPSGGKPDYVTNKHTLILSNDPVGADARAALLFGKDPKELGYIVLGEKWGLGTRNLNLLTLQKVEI